MSIAEFDANIEDIEGLGKSEDDVWGDYPIDTVLIRTEARTVFDVVRRMDKGSFIMNPDFQRDFLWPDKQSKLIESVLMRIPLPFSTLRKTRRAHDRRRRSTASFDFQAIFWKRVAVKAPRHPDLHRNVSWTLLPSFRTVLKTAT